MSKVQIIVNTFQNKTYSVDCNINQTFFDILLLLQNQNFVQNATKYQIQYDGITLDARLTLYDLEMGDIKNKYFINLIHKFVNPDLYKFTSIAGQGGQKKKKEKHKKKIVKKFSDHYPSQIDQSQKQQVQTLSNKQFQNIKKIEQKQNKQNKIKNKEKNVVNKIRVHLFEQQQDPLVIQKLYLDKMKLVDALDTQIQVDLTNLDCLIMGSKVDSQKLIKDLYKEYQCIQNTLQVLLVEKVEKKQSILDELD